MSRELNQERFLSLNNRTAGHRTLFRRSVKRTKERLYDKCTSFRDFGPISFNTTFFFRVLDTDYFLCCCCISGCDGSSDVSVGSCGLYLIRNKCIYCPYNLHEGTVFILSLLLSSLWISCAKKLLSQERIMIRAFWLYGQRLFVAYL